ncbi:transmembrane emp24 domain trafficking protein 2 [Nannochloropsis gaditana CCMP526]|uniref:Transmembrane emp24 domain trafficking protein 2 n=2 Tax=Nannochloropsis gaditana TaxID=72520 RepID=W7U870_9STRA|nr:transmembrane emp24 domain trafficking protein 2 [Nannochloropsis gaditana CCMP526]EKU19997.1 transmembrane emp24 domain trafficking protein 2 [Nannochloropsis gaditana CCMP526]EWM29134.1 transmembrane emp24 domain trafficking protein 2 [Nannochloropsis gaditana]|eukprot:XP_005856362.1 transmembrane emp24 domain trafficking protein 2 [Nannochloropsis gaditana CCMP526]
MWRFLFWRSARIPSRSLLVVLSLLLLILLLKPATSFTVEVAPGTVECYITVATQGDDFLGNFEVLTGGSYAPVEVTVEGPDGKLLWRAADKSEETFSFEAEENGDHTLCISNGARGRADDGIPRLVGFSFRTDVLVDEAIASEQSIRRLIELGNSLTKGLTNVMDHQSYMRQREDLHASTMESIGSRVLIWTVVEAVVLVGMAVWQISIISKFFEVRRAV